MQTVRLDQVMSTHELHTVRALVQSALAEIDAVLATRRRLRVRT